MCRFLEKEAAISSLIIGRLREKRKKIYLSREDWERDREKEREATQQAFTQKETVNDQSFQLFQSAGKSKYLLLS